MSDQSHVLVQKNLAVFNFISPRVAEMLRNELEKPSGVDATSHSQKAMRFPMNMPDRDGIDLYTFDFIEHLIQHCNSNKAYLLGAPRTEQSYYMLLVGAPSAENLDAALRKHAPKCLMIGIGDASLFAKSLSTIDWGDHINKIQQGGGTVYLFAETDPEAVVERVWRTCRTHNPTQIDNLTAIIQGTADLQQQIIASLTQTIMLSLAQLGFFHDETVMLWNTWQNRLTNRVRRFQRQTKSISDVPCFVVASGPSLENDIDIVKAHKDHAVVVSVASSLRSLLNAGITPDFHVELENVYITPKFAELSKTYDLSTIKLVAAASVEPAVFDYIDEAILYARYELSSYPAFATGLDETLRLPSPTAGNAALSFALESGFREVYLFGLDLGTYDQTKHHAGDSYYYTDGALEHPDVYDITVPGNFRDQIWTSRPFLSALKNAADLAKMFSGLASIKNCSDGARIDNAPPFPAADISVDASPGAKAKRLEELQNAFVAPTDSGPEWPGEALSASISAFFDRAETILNAPQSIYDGSYEARFLELVNLNMGYQDPPELGMDSSAVMLVRGTLLSIVTFMERFRARVAYPDKQKAFATIAAVTVSQSLAELRALALDQLGGATPKPPLPVDGRVASADRHFPKLISIPRNADCPCGSGIKFKRCHGKIT